MSAPESGPSVGILCLSERASNNNVWISLLVSFSHSLLDARSLISSLGGLVLVCQQECFIAQTKLKLDNKTKLKIEFGGV